MVMAVEMFMGEGVMATSVLSDGDADSDGEDDDDGDVDSDVGGDIDGDATCAHRAAVFPPLG